MKSPLTFEQLQAKVEASLQELTFEPNYTPNSDVLQALLLDEILPGSHAISDPPNDPKTAPYVHQQTKLTSSFDINELRSRSVVEWLNLHNYEKQVTALRTCGKGYAHLECSGGHVKYVQISCRRDYCPVCGEKGSKEHMRRSARVADRLLWAPVLGYFVGTLPKEIQGKPLDRKRLRKLSRGLWKIIQRHFTTQGCVIRYHLLGNSKGKFHIHINVLFPITDPAGRGKVEQRTLDLAQKEYTWLVNRVFDLEEKVCDIHYSFATTKKKMFHKIKYVMRPIVTTEDFIMLTDEEKHFIIDLEGWHNTRWFGSLSNAHYKKFLRASGIDPEARIKRDIELSPVCPVCGGRFRYLGVVSKDDIPRNRVRPYTVGVWVDRQIYNVLHDKGVP
jgi:hypothetical protein